MPTPAARQQRAEARYETLKSALDTLIRVVALGSLVLLLLIGQDVREGQQITLENQRTIKQLAEQNAADSLIVASLLERQQQNDKNRQKLIADAVAQIAQEQRDALAEHDRSVKDFLGQTLSLVDQEVNAPASQEDAPVVVPVPQPVVVMPPPAAPPPASPRPQQQPRAFAERLPIPPPPPPCDPLGKSGRCRK